MVDTYIEPGFESFFEIKISKSRFLAHVKICKTEDEVRKQLKEICNIHRQANHNCWAYRIGAESVSEYFSDDGEPAGTAGKPILGAIARQDLTNTLVVVTRYFGGIKLGVRGLIEAYGTSASEALRLAGSVHCTVKATYTIVVPYGMIKTLQRLFASVGAIDEDISWQYGEKVDIVCSLPRVFSTELEMILMEMINTGRLYSWEKV